MAQREYMLDCRTLSFRINQFPFVLPPLFTPYDFRLFEAPVPPVLYIRLEARSTCLGCPLRWVASCESICFSPSPSPHEGQADIEPRRVVFIEI